MPGTPPRRGGSAHLLKSKLHHERPVRAMGPATERDRSRRGAVAHSRADAAQTNEANMIPRRISYEWLTWGVSAVVTGGLPADLRTRIAAERTRADALRVVTRTIPIPWVEDRSLAARFIGHNRRLAGPWQRSAVMAFGASDVHLESFGGRGWGPGFVFTDVRILIDGIVAGRAWKMGCSLGAGGRAGPAVAMLRDDLALRVGADMRNIEVIRLR